MVALTVRCQAQGGWERPPHSETGLVRCIQADTGAKQTGPGDSQVGEDVRTAARDRGSCVGHGRAGGGSQVVRTRADAGHAAAVHGDSDWEAVALRALEDVDERAVGFSDELR